MLINFNAIAEKNIAEMNGGSGKIAAKIYMEEQGKIILSRIHTGSSIGIHRHITSDDINYILSGTGKAICDDKEENLIPGVCHICKKGSKHSIINTGTEDLIIVTIVTER